MKKNILLFLFLFFSSNIIAQKKAFVIFDSDGNQTTYQELVNQSEEADIVLFGELHDNPINHWLQLELTKDLFNNSEKLVLGAEMMESDNQLVIDEYITGMVSVSKLKSETKIWPNFKTDYLPLIQFSKQNKLSFIATNAPRRYASIVYQHGLDTLSFLSDKAKSYMAPLPILYDTSLSSYQEMFAMGMGHGGDNLPKSQALKDATMAHFILENWKKGQTFIHFHGAFHSKNYEGINWYLKQESKRIKTITISSYEQDDLNQLDEGQIGIADFIIVTPTNMTKTH
jgi:uncharacterized iron-regulated protein